MIETDVLVVGCGPAGLTASMALARQGVNVTAVTKHSKLAPTPRAHVTNQRTFEILRDFDLEEEALSLATSYTRMPNQLFLRSLIGPEYGRIHGLLLDDRGNAEASPCTIADLPQHLLEPLLFQKSVEHGANIRFDTELTSFTQDQDGVTACLEDHVTGKPLTVRARYLIGADGGKSKVAKILHLPFEGLGKLGGSLNILFECDLAPYVQGRAGLLFFIVRTALDRGGAGLGILRCVKPWTSWLMIKGYAAGQVTPRLTEEEAVDVVRDYLGIADLELRITGVDPWDLNSICASVYHDGRIFCMGDAVHRHAPSNGLGSNTAIQDAYNLAWKLSLVLKNIAGSKLLASYSEERVPVGQQVVARATKSVGTYTAILDAVGVSDGQTPEENETSEAELTADNDVGRQRRTALRKSIHEKVYEFHTRGIELNHFYRSLAIIHEGQTLPQDQRDPELFYRSTTCPGARLPHARVQREGKDNSTLDLVGKDRFTVLTGIGGERWIAAAEAVSLHFGIEISAVAIGPGCHVEDLYFEWADRREIEENGCLLVRPDGFIAWRCENAASGECEKILSHVIGAILDRDSL